MLSTAVNGYTAAQVNRALQGLDAKPVYGARADYLDAEGQLLYALDGLDLSSSSVHHDSDAPVKRNAPLRFRQTERNAQHSAPLGTFAEVITAQQRLFHLRLSETSGNAADFTGNGRTFTANGTIAYSQESLTLGDATNNAFGFNGTNAYLSIADAAWMDVTRITLSAWIKTSSTVVNQTILARSGAFLFRSLQTSGFLQVELSSSGTQTFTTSVKVADGAYHHVAAAYDGAYVRVYVDGRLVLKTALTGNLDATTNPIHVGANAAATLFFNGYLDEVGMVGRALTSREIWDEYQAGSAQRNELLYDKKRGHSVRIYRSVQVPDDGGYAEWARFTGQLPTLRVEYTRTGNVLNFTAYDYTKRLMDATLPARTPIAAAINYITGTNGVLALAQAQGFDTSNWAVTVTTKTVPAAFDFEKGSSVLDAINYLLTAINYAPIRFSGVGVGIIEPNKLDTELTVQDAVSSTENGALQIIGAQALGFELEPFQVPNTVTVFNANPDAPYITVTESNSLVQSATSTKYNPVREELFQVDVADSSTGTALARQFLNNLTADYAELLNYETLLYPVLDDKDRRAHTIPELGINKDYIIKVWDEPLDPLTMTRITARSVVVVTA